MSQEEQNKTNSEETQDNTIWPHTIGHIEEDRRHNRGGLIRDSRGIALNQEEKDANHN